MINFEYEENITPQEKETIEVFENLLKGFPEMKLTDLMKQLEIYEPNSYKDINKKYRIGSGATHIFVCRINKNFDRIFIATEN